VLPSTPAAADVGDAGHTLLLGLALLAITVGMVGTAISKRRGASA